MHGEILQAACTELLLMMNNYFFEACRGQSKTKKIFKKSVHLVGLPHVCVS